jgi:hypothetical protein
MSSRRKEIVTAQKASFEQMLKNRLAKLAEKGIKGKQADRDPIAKKLKAEVKASTKRLARIAELEKRTEEMIRIKAEKAAAPKKAEEPKGAKPKAAAKEGKPKKEKPEGAKGEAKPPKKKPEEAKEAPAAPAAPAKAEK